METSQLAIANEEESEDKKEVEDKETSTAISLTFA
jgi:hypothetical protein